MSHQQRYPGLRVRSSVSDNMNSLLMIPHKAKMLYGYLILKLINYKKPITDIFQQFVTFHKIIRYIKKIRNT
jgi:hypothetical protein